MIFVLLPDLFMSERSDKKMLAALFLIPSCFCGKTKEAEDYPFLYDLKTHIPLHLLSSGRFLTSNNSEKGGSLDGVGRLAEGRKQKKPQKVQFMG
jgi:hypothetical protein